MIPNPGVFWIIAVVFDETEELVVLSDSELDVELSVLVELVELVELDSEVVEETEDDVGGCV